MYQKTVLITGASSGMGYAAAQLFADKGWQVYAGARRVEKIPQATNIHALYLDVTVAESNQTFVQAAVEAQKRIDVLINNAGYGEFGPLEDVSMDKAHNQLDTNLFGAAELAKLVLPTMRTQGFGRIINISSIGGDLYTPLGGWYYVSKHALNTWSDTLDTEIRPFGVRSLIVEPGGTESSWSAIAMKNAKANLQPNSVYEPITNNFDRILDKWAGSVGVPAETLARVFYRAATDPKPKLRYFNNFQDRLTARFARVHQVAFHGLMSLVTKHYSH